MRRYAAIIIVSALLSGCSEEKAATYTVEELIADENLLSQTLAECRNNPGDLRGTANCTNAEAADGKLRLQNMRRALRN